MENNKKAQSRRNKLEALKLRRESVNPKLTCDFLCPICKCEFNFCDPLGATEAHVIPHAAGGKLTTYLCRKCNSTAGAGIDYWLGEYLRITKGESLLATSRKSERVKINDLDFGAKIVHQKNSDIKVYIFSNRSSPANLCQLKSAIAQQGLRTIEKSVPLMGQTDSVNLGVLQAAYLWHFCAFGYSVVFQKSLDVVRAQLKEPEKKILGKQLVAKTLQDHGDFIGAATVNDVNCLIACIGGRMAFLPTVGAESFYENLPNDYREASIKAERFHGASIDERVSYGLIIKDRVWVWPDSCLEPPRLHCLHLENLGAELRILYPINKEEFDSYSDPEKSNTISIIEPKT